MHRTKMRVSIFWKNSTIKPLGIESSITTIADGAALYLSAIHYLIRASPYLYMYFYIHVLRNLDLIYLHAAYIVYIHYI